MTRSVRPSKNTAVSAPSMVPLPSASYLAHSLKQHAAGCTGQAGVGREEGGGGSGTLNVVYQKGPGETVQQQYAPPPPPFRWNRNRPSLKDLVGQGLQAGL